MRIYDESGIRSFLKDRAGSLNSFAETGYTRPSPSPAISLFWKIATAHIEQIVT